MPDESQEIKESDTILREANISLILDSYDDLFSDFDPRPYSERALSDDFLFECKKAAREKRNAPQALELRFLIPTKKRVKAEENRIKKRLKDYFLNQAKEKQKEVVQSRRDGIKWLLIGIAFSLISTLLINQEGLIYSIPLIITEPGGWFSLWTGLDKVFLETKAKKPELEFHNRMAKMSVKFYSY